MGSSAAPPRVVVVLQARTNSSRLPGKVLLPIRNIPVAVLAAKRAANTGFTVRLVTSTCPSDDQLAAVAAAHGVDCFRGSLDDVLNRFVSALEEYPPETLVVRITADNVFPDGEFIQDVLDAYLRSGCEFMTTVFPGNGVPLGIAAEVTTLRLLRLADELTDCGYDREHVMPYIERNQRVAYFDGYAHFRTSMLRCTIDYLDDYLRVCDVFSVVGSPVEASCKDLMRILAERSRCVTTEAAAARLVVHTRDAAPGLGGSAWESSPDMRAFFSEVVENGIRYVQIGNETAVTRRRVAKAIGKLSCDNFTVACLPVEPDEALAPGCAREAADALLYRYCMLLRREAMDTFLLDQAAQLDALDVCFLERLDEHRREGRIGAVGVVVRTGAELERALAEPAVTLVQLPFAPDYAFFHAALDRIRAAAGGRELTVQVRDAWDDASSFWWAGCCQEYGFSSGLELCCSYLQSLDGVQGILLDACNPAQLREALAAYTVRPLADGERARVESALLADAR